MIELLNWNFPAAGKQTKLNLIGRIRHVIHLRANSVHLEPQDYITNDEELFIQKLIDFKVIW